MEGEIIISESLGLKTTVGAVIRLVALVIVATIAYQSLRYDLTNAIEQGKRNESQIENTRVLLDRARMDMGGISTKLDMFFDSYNRDMNRYVRTDKDRR